MSLIGGDIKTRGNCGKGECEGCYRSDKKGGYIQLDSIMEVFSKNGLPAIAFPFGQRPLVPLHGRGVDSKVS